MKIKKGYMPNETTHTIMVEGIIHEEEKELAFVVLKELQYYRTGLLLLENIKNVEWKTKQDGAAPFLCLLHLKMHSS